MASQSRDFRAATAYYEEGLALFRGLGDTRDVAYCLSNLGTVAQELGDFERAKALYGESLALVQEIGDRGVIGPMLYNVGMLEELLGDYSRATERYLQSLNLLWQIGHLPQVAVCLALLAGRAGAAGQLVQAARLFGAADAIDHNYGGYVSLSDRAMIARNCDAVRQQLGIHAFEQGWAEGQASPLEKIVGALLASTAGTHALKPVDSPFTYQVTSDR
jgi:tetratricopeptide (TPR) repeat protein